VFNAIEGMVQYNEPLRSECEVQSRVIYCANGTEIKALSSEYSTAASRSSRGGQMPVALPPHEAKNPIDRIFRPKTPARKWPRGSKKTICALCSNSHSVGL
jgi:hypothetical protein